MGPSIDKTNEFYEFSSFMKNKKELLNLLEFEDFRRLLPIIK